VKRRLNEATLAEVKLPLAGEEASPSRIFAR
jgi:hypothetical protein